MRRAAVVLAALSALAACETEPPSSGSNMDLAFTLVDETGRRVTETDFDGQLRLVLFGFTSCPDSCPITLTNVSAALNEMGELSQQVAVLFISIDPKRDTPERLQAHTATFHPSVIGLTGNYLQIERATTAFGTTFGFTVRDGTGAEQPLNRIEYETIPAFSEYMPFHGSEVYIIDASGELVDTIGYDSKPEFIEQSLRSHLR